jgi:hypothetical protein
MVKKTKQISQFKLMRVSNDSLDFLGSLCSKGMSYDDALLKLIKIVSKPNFKELLA